MRRLAAVVAIALTTGACGSRDKIPAGNTTEQAAILSSSVNASDPATAFQLVQGFYGVEQNSWRWTKQAFTVTLKAVPSARLRARLTVPEPVLSRVGPMTLTAKVGNTVIGKQTWKEAGESTFEADIPESALKGDAVTVDFTLDKFLAGGTVEIRELGLIFQSASLEKR